MRDRWRPGFRFQSAGRKPGYWCRALRASGFFGPSLGMALSPDLAHGFIDDALQLGQVCIGVALSNVLHCAVKHSPADGLLNKFREVALLVSPRAKKSAQGEGGLFRALDVPANG